ncbi:MAG TPA: hypothetical protein VF006_21555 [Longimicrobium sp.]
MHIRLRTVLAAALAAVLPGGCEPVGALSGDALRRPAIAPLEWPDSVEQGDSAVLRIQVLDHGGVLLTRVLETKWAGPGVSFRPDATGLEALALFRLRGQTVVRVLVRPGAAYPPLEGIDTLFVRTSWTALGVGDGHSCGVAFDQAFYCWGSADGGRIGGASADRVVPGRVVLQSESVGSWAVTASAGGAHTCVLMTDGTARCMGENAAGQLGNGGTASSGTDARVLAGPTTRYAGVAAGAAHTCAVATDGAVDCWGANGAGQLGTAAPADRCGGSLESCARLPRAVPGLPAMAQVSAGAAHTCAASVLERVYCWGDPRYGATADPALAAPHRVDAGVLLAVVAAGGRHTCALTPGGAAYCWGADDRGQLGRAGADESCAGVRCSSRPVAVGAGIGFTVISSGAAHTCAVATNGRVYCWGSNEHGQLGAPTVADAGCDGVPCARTPVPAATPILFRSVSAGAGHTCGISVDLRAYCWGRNAHGQLGLGSREVSAIPVPLQEAP